MMNNNIMNPMGINPLPMNNMGMMMNNQPNLMDQTAMNIKQIIQPYENKIRELDLQDDVIIEMAPGLSKTLPIKYFHKTNFGQYCSI